MESNESIAEHRSGANFAEGILTLLALIVLFLLVFGSTLRAELNYIDDHELIRFATMGRGHPQFQPVNSLVDFINYDGRFRPLYFIIRIAITQMIGAEPHAWHLTMLIMGIATCWFLYLAARKFRLDRLSSAFFLLWIIAAQGASEIWVRMGPSEPYGLLFTSLALWSLSHISQTGRRGRWDAAWLIFMLFAGLTKESFVVLFPAMLLLRWLLVLKANNHREILNSIRQMIPLLVIGGVIFITLLFFVLRTYRLESYAAGVTSFSLQSFLPESWYTQLAILSPTAAYYLPIFAFLLLAAVYPIAGGVKLLVAALVFAAWVIPQFILHPGGLLNLRFAYPAIVGLAGANAAALARLRRRSLHIAFRLVAIGSLVILLQPLVGTLNFAQRFAAETQSIHQMVETIVAETDANEVVVVASNPGARVEASFSVVSLLAYEGLQEPVYLYVAALPNENDETNTRLAEMVINSPTYAGYNDVSQLSAESVSRIIVLMPVDVFLQNPPEWFDPSLWHQEVFTEPIMVVSRSGYRQDGEAAQITFVRNTS